MLLLQVRQLPNVIFQFNDQGITLYLVIRDGHRRGMLVEALEGIPAGHMTFLTSPSHVTICLTKSGVRGQTC